MGAYQLKTKQMTQQDCGKKILNQYGGQICKMHLKQYKEYFTCFVSTGKEMKYLKFSKVSH